MSVTVDLAPAARKVFAKPRRTLGCEKKANENERKKMSLGLSLVETKGEKEMKEKRLTGSPAEVG